MSLDDLIEYYVENDIPFTADIKDSYNSLAMDFWISGSDVDWEGESYVVIA